ncbi:MAG: hypothetical protein SFY66_17010 [Oculatellaceae cyanobacterium bins.114]|nr:hypothetical protein [Oculatellaceae cyanobacterium bins.114]
MKIYRYYEFQSQDRPLTEAEQSYISSLWSRVQLTPVSATFTYHYDDFRGNPLKLLEKCFDVMVHLASDSDGQLVFRLPCAVFDAIAIKPYDIDHVITLITTPLYVLLTIPLNPQTQYTRTEYSQLISTLAELRYELLQGDFRVLYLAWLRAAEMSILLEKDPLEPPVPVGLQQLSVAQQAFVSLVEIPAQLITAAAIASPLSKSIMPKPTEPLPTTSPNADHTTALIQLVQDEPHMTLPSKTKLAPQTSQRHIDPVQPVESRRHWSELKAIAHQISQTHSLN